MIYTSYFAQIRNLPNNIIPIAICGGVPQWYSGLWYKKLASKYKFFMEWKQNHNNEFYIEHFYNEVLINLVPEEVESELYALLPEDKKNACSDTPLMARHFIPLHKVLNDLLMKY